MKQYIPWEYIDEIIRHRIRMYGIYGLPFTINIPQMLAYIPYMDPSWVRHTLWFHQLWLAEEFCVQMGIFVLFSWEDHIELWRRTCSRPVCSMLCEDISNKFLSVYGCLWTHRLEILSIQWECMF